MTGVFLVAWIEPARVGGERGVASLVGLMVMEFLVIHSSAFLGSLALAGKLGRGHLKEILGLSAVYLSFALGVSLGFKNPWFLVGFIGLHANRLVPVLLGRGASAADNAAWLGRWALGAVLYLFAAFLTVLLPVPGLGVTFSLSGYGSGLWVDDPQRALAMGVLYFGLQGLLGFTLARSGRGLRVEGRHVRLGGRPTRRE